MKYVKLVGLELEGGWSKPLDDNYHLIADHSVCSGRRDAAHVLWPVITNKVGKSCMHIGELASAPMTLENAIKWMHSHYPCGSNGSCGFHVHVSVRTPLMYRSLTKKRFWAHFLAEAEKFGNKLWLPKEHSYWARLRGENRFCLRKFRPLAQMSLNTKPQSGEVRDLRRCILNYCYVMHGTLECRLFPMWELPEQAEASVRWFVNLVEGYLAKTRSGRVRRRRLLISTSACYKSSNPEGEI